MTTPRWSDEDLVLAWEVGREYEAARVAEAGEELRLVELVGPPVPHEQRVAERVALFERCAEQTAAKLGRRYVEFHGRQQVAA